MLSFKTLIRFCLVGVAAAQGTRGTNVNAGSDNDGKADGPPYGPIAIGGWVVGGFICMVVYHFYNKKQEKLAAAQKARDEELAEKDKQVTSVIQQLSREIADLKSISQATFKQLSKVDYEAEADAAVKSGPNGHANGHPATAL